MKKIKKFFKILTEPFLNLILFLFQNKIVLKKNISPIWLAADFVFAENIDGDYLEFGVFQGSSFIEAYKACEQAKKWGDKKFNMNAFENKTDAINSYNMLKIKQNIRYFAFDSFEGLPKMSEEEKLHSRFHEGRFKSSKNYFLDNCKNNNINLNKIVICEGFYEKSLTNDFLKSNKLKAAAIVMIDCDLYSSTKAVLNFITPLIQDGSIIIFDDWFCYKGAVDRGQQKATNEWLQNNKNIKLYEFARYGIAQKAFVVSKQN